MTTEMAVRLLPGVPMNKYVADDFHEGPPSLNSGLANVLLAKSAAHCRYGHPRLNPALESDDDTKFDVGTAVHAVLLEDRELFGVEYPDYRSRQARAVRDEAKAAGKIPVLTHLASDIACMVTSARAALRDCPDLAGLGDLLAERTILWEQSGALLRCRPDWLTTDYTIVLSVKTTRASAEHEAFLRTIMNLGYDTQAAFELAGARAATGVAPTHYVWVVIETAAPFATSLIGLSPMLRDLGERKLARAVQLWTHCLASDEWPGYSGHVVYPDPPEWAVSQWAERHLYTDDSVEAL